MAVDAETIFDVYPEFILKPAELETFKRERNSCIVGADIAKRSGFKIGDVIPLEGDIYPGHWEFVVRGIYQPRDKVTDATQMYFHWNYLDERMKQDMPGRTGQVGWYIIKIKDPAQAATISEEVDALFKNSSNETKTETERAFQQGFVSGYQFYYCSNELCCIYYHRYHHAGAWQHDDYVGPRTNTRICSVQNTRVLCFPSRRIDTW